MTNYTYGQLETLWINAGGPKSVAPLMAAIALAESDGNPDAVNASTDSTGLWQINLSAGNGSYVPGGAANATNPADNAAAAVAIYKAQGLDAWETYTNGAYEQFYQGNVPASSLPQGGSGGSSTTTTASVTSLDPTDALNAMGELLHGAAEGLNFFFWLWEPGQRWRLAMGIGGTAATFGAFKLYTSPSVQQEKNAAFPAAILLTGIAFMCLYMTFRSWPVSSTGKPMRPAAYLDAILTGQKPAAGPPSVDETDAIQGGLEVIASVWIVNKATSAISGIAGAAGILGGIWSSIKSLFSGSGGGSEGEEIPDIPDVGYYGPTQAPGAGTETV